MSTIKNHVVGMLLAAVFLFFVSSSAAAQKKPPSFLYFTTQPDRASTESLRKLLHEDMKHTFAVAEKLDDVLKSDADVLILEMPADRTRSPCTSRVTANM